MNSRLSRITRFSIPPLLIGIALFPSVGRAQVRAAPRRVPPQIATPDPAPRVARAATDMFLKIDGIEGESKAEGHGDWIEIQSWSWGPQGTSADRRAPSGGGPGTLVLVKTVDKSSPKLTEACNRGRSIGRMVVHLRSAGGTGYDEYVAQDVTVRSCSQNSSGDRPTETLTLNFGKIESGDPDRPVVTGR